MESGIYMNILKRLLISVFCLSIAVSCEPPSVDVISPECRITDRSDLIIPVSGFSTMNFTVKNIGDGPNALHVEVEVKLKKGDLVVDESSTYFGTLIHEESKSEDVIFTRIKNYTEYDRVIVSLSWYDAEGVYYY